MILFSPISRKWKKKIFFIYEIKIILINDTCREVTPPGVISLAIFKLNKIQWVGNKVMETPSKFEFFNELN